MNDNIVSNGGIEYRPLSTHPPIVLFGLATVTSRSKAWLVFISFRLQYNAEPPVDTTTTAARKMGCFSFEHCYTTGNKVKKDIQGIP